MISLRAAALLAIMSACGPSSDSRERVPREEPRSRRVIEPPVGIVRPLPPHLISANGVGPYRLGDRLADLMQQLPSGPRIANFEIPGVLHRSLIRAEEGDSVLVGGEPSSVATFIAVVDPQVARTEAGIHVGSTRDELAKSGPVLVDPSRARDPRIVVPAALRGLRIVFDPDRTKDRVAAIVVTSDPPPAPREADLAACPRPASTATAFGACMAGSGAGELITVDGTDLVVRGVETEKIIAAVRMPTGVEFVAPLRFDGRDELVVVVRTEEPTELTWSLIAYRLDAGKLVRSIEPSPLYSVSAANARWIGVELRAIDLILDLAAGRDVIEVGGLLTTDAELPDAAQTPWRDVVVISPVTVARRHGKPLMPEGIVAPGGGLTEGSGAAVRAPIDAGGGSAAPQEAGSATEPASTGSTGTDAGRSK